MHHIYTGFAPPPASQAPKRSYLKQQKPVVINVLLLPKIVEESLLPRSTDLTRVTLQAEQAQEPPGASSSKN